MRRIPLSQPDIQASERAAVSRVLESTVLSRGPELARFEAAMQAYCQVEHAVGVSSGTAALEIILKGLDIGVGDEVITPSFTVPATVNAIANTGARPVLVDIESENLGLDPVAVRQAISSTTKAIIVVHAFGMTAAIEPLVALAQEHALHLVEDACEALGTTWQGRQLGTFGIAGAFGFYPNKQITCGEGGMIITRDDALARACTLLRNNGRTMDGTWLDQERNGMNARLPEVAAALGATQLNRLEDIIRQRADTARRYHAQLMQIDTVKSYLSRPAAERTSWFAVCLMLENNAGRPYRDSLAKELAHRGIQTGRYFAPLHWQPAMAEWIGEAQVFPATELVASNCLALPLFNELPAADVTYVCEQLALLLSQHPQELSDTGRV